MTFRILLDFWGLQRSNAFKYPVVNLNQPRYNTAEGPARRF